MKSGTFVTLVCICLVVVALGGMLSVYALTFRGESRINFDALGLTVIIARTTDNRTLSVVGRNGEHADVKLVAEWGPKLRTNLYKNTEGGLSIIDFDGTWNVHPDPLRLEQSWPSDEWQYLGTLMLSGYKTAQQEPECMDILMEGEEPLTEPSSLRDKAYRGRC